MTGSSDLVDQPARPGWCPVQSYETVYLCRDPLGDYPVVLCPRCGATVPLGPRHRIGGIRPVPGHRRRSARASVSGHPR